jgi:hypothetical protein
MVEDATAGEEAWFPARAGRVAVVLEIEKRRMIMNINK